LFDGIDDLVFVDDNDPPMSPDYYGDFEFSTSCTIEAWIKPSTLVLAGSYAAVLQGKTASGGGAFALNLRTTPPGSWALSVCVPSCNAATSPEDNLDAFRWQHVAGVYDGSAITIYRNGQEIAVEPWSGDVSDAVNLVIGRWEVGSTTGFPGVIEDVRIWNVARSQSEILSTMYGGISGSEPGLMGYWRFNEGSGQYTADSSGRNNYGRLGWDYQADAGDPVWVVYDPPSVLAPSHLFVERWETHEPMFDCADEVKPPLDAFEEFAFYWEGVPFEEVLQVDGYQYQFFANPSCEGSPILDHQWDVSETAWAYGFIHPPSPGRSCYRVRSWERSPQGTVFSGWSPCCCFDVLASCTPLATPAITGVGDTTCEGTTLQTSPLLRWGDVSDNSGYRWEVWTSTGTLVDSGTTATNVSVATVGPLDPGAYVARVQARGDGESFCDSDWSSDCAFEVAEPACETLPTPEISAVGDTTCGGSTAETSPLLRWGQVSDNSGYRWEVRTSEGNLVDSGTAGKSVTVATVRPLDPGEYVAQVQARGDGEDFCDSEWSEACSFEVLSASEIDADFTWWPEQPKQGESVRFADLSSPTPLSWYWQLGDGSTSTAQNPAHIFDGTGDFDVSLQAQFESGEDSTSKSITVSGSVECGDDICEGGETAWSCPTDCALEPEETGRAGGSDRRPSVPVAVGGAEGLKGTLWKTEGWVFNPGPESTRLVIEFTPRDDESVADVGPFELEPQQELHWENIVEQLFATTGKGSLWLDSRYPVHFLTRSYNLTGHGTFGQGVPAIKQKLTIGRGDGEVFLVGLQEDASFRSNLFFQEVNGEWVTVHIEVFNDSGSRLRQRDVSVEAHSGKLQSLAGLGVGDEESVYATVEVTAGEGRVAVVASVIDQITGDPTTVDPVHPDQLLVKETAGAKDSQEHHQLVAVIAHTEGEADSVWRTKVVIKNPAGGSEKTVRLVYRPDYDSTGLFGRSKEATWTLQAGRQKRWKDVLVDLFGLPGDGKTQGSLHVYSPESLIIRSRTYNERPGGGTYGQEMRALGRGDLIDVDRTGVIIGLQHSPDTRTNIGIAEFSGEETDVKLTFFSSRLAPRYLGTITVTVAAKSHRQVFKVFERLGLADDWSNDIIAFVTVQQGGSAYVYASTIDNVSGDATTTVAAKK
jgi:PKD repeat protein